MWSSSRLLHSLPEPIHSRPVLPHHPPQWSVTHNVLEPALSSSSSSDLPLHLHRAPDVKEHQTSKCTHSRIQGWLCKALARSNTLSLRKLVIIALTFCVLSKLLLTVDDIQGALSENIFSRYVDGKRCVYLYRSHIESDFYDPESCFSRTDVQQIILGLVWTLSSVLEQHSIPYWLDSGTLLGAYREKTMIAHDDDADVGVSEASYVQLRDNKIEFPSEYELQVLGGKFHRQGKRDAAIASQGG